MKRGRFEDVPLKAPTRGAGIWFMFNVLGFDHLETALLLAWQKQVLPLSEDDEIKAHANVRRAYSTYKRRRPARGWRRAKV